MSHRKKKLNNHGSSIAEFFVETNILLPSANKHGVALRTWFDIRHFQFCCIIGLNRVYMSLTYHTHENC